MNKLHTLILMCLLSLVGISANAQGFHPCDANHDGTVDVADIAITANYILTGEYQPDEPADAAPVVTGDATDVTYTKATINASVNLPAGVTVFGIAVIYSENEEPAEDNGMVSEQRITVDGNTASDYSFEISGLNYNTTYYYRTRLQAYPDRKTYYGEVKSFTTKNPGSTEGESVDLGLPSGVKWATCNLGATSMEQLGDLYAWGETSSKETFTQANYEYYFIGDYVDIGSDIRGTQYDAATASWKGAWHMPTQEEFAELQSECEWTKTTCNGVQGYMVIGKNGNSYTS